MSEQQVASMAQQAAIPSNLRDTVSALAVSTRG